MNPITRSNHTDRLGATAGRAGSRGRRVAAVLGAAALALAACGDDAPDGAAATTVASVDAGDTITGDTITGDTITGDTITGDTITGDTATSAPDPRLDDAEVAGLLWMREEEQLAHDVYVALGERWDARVFENIAPGEVTHLESVAALLDAHGIADPAAGNEPGTFTDPAIQVLYDEMVEAGSESLADALAVGARIEELDIADLGSRAAATDEADIAAVYARLEQGSRNHLRAFTSQLVLLGVDHVPTVLDPDDYDAIVSSPMERGQGHGQYSGQGHDRGNGRGHDDGHGNGRP